MHFIDSLSWSQRDESPLLQVWTCDAILAKDTRLLFSFPWTSDRAQRESKFLTPGQTMAFLPHMRAPSEVILIFSSAWRVTYHVCCYLSLHNKKNSRTLSPAITNICYLAQFLRARNPGAAHLVALTQGFSKGYSQTGLSTKFIFCKPIEQIKKI